MKSLGNLLIPLVLVLIVASLSVYTVDQRQTALVFQLGEIVKVDQEPGLYFKLPFVQKVRYFDTRVLTLDAGEPERFITSEKKNVLVDYFVKWRIIDVKKFYVSFPDGEKRAMNRLAQTINDGMRAEFGKRTVHDVVSGERDQIMKQLQANADMDARRFGVQVLDVRIKRVELPTEVSDSVYKRMEAERKQVANELRSTGAAEEEQIKADADRQRAVVIADAYKEAQTLKGEGDAKAAAIYSAAYGKNPEFYAFYRSMDSYKASFKDKHDVMVLQPNSAFFRYMQSPRGGGK